MISCLYLVSTLLVIFAFLLLNTTVSLLFLLNIICIITLLGIIMLIINLEFLAFFLLIIYMGGVVILLLFILLFIRQSQQFTYISFLKYLDYRWFILMFLSIVVIALNLQNTLDYLFKLIIQNGSNNYFHFNIWYILITNFIKFDIFIYIYKMKILYYNTQAQNIILSTLYNYILIILAFFSKLIFISNIKGIVMFWVSVKILNIFIFIFLYKSYLIKFIMFKLVYHVNLLCCYIDYILLQFQAWLSLKLIEFNQLCFNQKYNNSYPFNYDRFIFNYNYITVNENKFSYIVYNQNYLNTVANSLFTTYWYLIIYIGLMLLLGIIGSIVYLKK